MRTLIDRLFLGAIFILSAMMIFLYLTPAFAAAPNFSFAADTLGMKEPVWITILNAVFWLILGLVIVAIILEIFRRPWVRERYTSAEYNEAVGLRRHFIQDGGEKVPKAEIPVGSAIFMVGVITVERAFALGVIALIVYAAVS